MKNRRYYIKKTVFLSLCTAVALLLSYVEAIIPPIYAAVPGIKIGLANIAVLFILFRCGLCEAFAVSLVRITISSLLFGNAATFLYSFSGAVLSILLMTLLKRLDFLTVVGVSIAGGIAHNLGQVLLAMVVLNTAEVGYFMIILAVSGALAGFCVGLCGGIAVKRIKLDGGE